MAIVCFNVQGVVDPRDGHCLLYNTLVCVGLWGYGLPLGALHPQHPKRFFFFFGNIFFTTIIIDNNNYPILFHLTLHELYSC